ncbi:MAG: hypothetical protein M3N16_05395 [Actinomycetota bacterium]|nr:hypothetical protein [Actinomycetota bacterium]
MASAPAPHPPGANADDSDEAGALLPSLAEEAPQVRRLLAHIDARVDRIARELEALERRLVERRSGPVADDSPGECEALLARAVRARSTLLELHVSSSLAKALVDSRLDELEQRLSATRASVTGGGRA